MCVAYTYDNFKFNIDIWEVFCRFFFSCSVYNLFIGWVTLLSTLIVVPSDGRWGIICIIWVTRSTCLLWTSFLTSLCLANTDNADIISFHLFSLSFSFCSWIGFRLWYFLYFDCVYCWSSGSLKLTKVRSTM